MRFTASLSVLLLGTSLGCGGSEPIEGGRALEVEEELVLRVATFNIEDLRTSELQDPSEPQPRMAAAVCQRGT